MNEIRELIAEEIRHQFHSGRKQTDLARELDVHRRMVGHIVWGERRIGFETYAKILRARPPWLRHILTDRVVWEMVAMFCDGFSDGRRPEKPIDGETREESH